MTTDIVQTLASALHPGNSWEIAYPVVEHEARAWLEQLNEYPGSGASSITTEELVEALWPEAVARGDMILRRSRLYKALAALAEHGLSDCCTKGPERKLKHGNRVVRPWLWHKPKEDACAYIAKQTGVSRAVVEKVLKAAGVEIA